MNRYLTTSERTFLAMAREVTMNPVVMVRCSGPLPVPALRRALVAIQAKHPALRVKVVRGDRPWFSDREVGPIPLKVVERRDDEHWRELVREELNVPHAVEDGPLIRFVLVQGEAASELICTTDHVNADGRSGLFVLRDVLRLIDDPELRLVPLRPRGCFDDYLPHGPWDGRLPDSLRGLWAERTRSLLARVEARGRRGVLGDLGVVAREPLEPAPAAIELVHRRVDAARAEALVRACRSRDNTVLSALVVACAHAGATLEDEAASGLIGCVTPIDIRSMLSPSVGDDFGIFAWAPTSLHPVGPGADFWGLARRTRRIVRAYRSMPALAGMRRLLDAMEFVEGTAFAGLYEQLGRNVLDGLMVVSNLGRVWVPERVAGVEVEGFGFFAMIPNIDFVLGVQSFRGVLELNYCYSPQWIRGAAVEGVADRVEAVLDAAIGLPARGSARQLNF
ncbi:hypothetical protein G6O69_31690 [Pseudenhygromyxa sp. WMMC2535]|uniref:phthiocerol/phthiodiolone dimycocerosyl transferase family protein n=1 Tax=Pseudenhygromyxa sp. WMMC2535 TaxID=2712867 RepID=UPI001555BBB3|nr:hypothetical protein [Pseudenhygromyxa sp. WMMC2535]NVB42429.1 hypothetical protein [Pseudenhygromyxa sp. WMMC2535]